MSGLPLAQAWAFEEITFLLASVLVLVTMVSNWLIRMSHRLYYDPLMQIYNREYCDAILEERSPVVFKKPSSAVMLDIDHFKKVNDTFGHAAGDRVLQYVAAVISNHVIPHGIACRYGGEEIAVFFPDLSAKEAQFICEQVRLAVKRGGVESGRRKINVTLSGGIAELRSTTVKALESADKALYEAKRTGRDKIVVGNG
jgi:diguanylate cyclase (GGDEF)-like protein